MKFDKAIDRLLEGVPDNGVAYEQPISEGMILSVNKMVSDAIKIPHGDYLVWAITADTCTLIPTNESEIETYEISRPTLKGFYNPEIHKKVVVNHGPVIAEAADPIDAKILSLVREKLSTVGRLKTPIAAGELDLNKIIASIKTERCVSTSDRDFGGTYLEQIVGTAIRETVPIDYINRARQLFGLEKLSESELYKKKKESVSRRKI